jgi:hypothetical protein
MAARKALYRIRFRNEEQIFELYAREVSHGALLGFIEVGRPVFGESSTLLVDPGEEKLKALFEGVERFFVPVHAVIRIDQVASRGSARIQAAGEGAKVTPFPVFTPPPRG